MKVVAISGGGQGIGRAVALHCTKAGYGVSIADTDREAGRKISPGPVCFWPNRPASLLARI